MIVAMKPATDVAGSPVPIRADGISAGMIFDSRLLRVTLYYGHRVTRN